jgi:hypothetical protein
MWSHSDTGFEILTDTYSTTPAHTLITEHRHWLKTP